MKNLLIAQSGGPSAAINATVAGVIEKGKASKKIDKIYGGLYGIAGILNGQLLELDSRFQNTQELSLLCQTPAAALGSCRHKLKSAEQDASDYERIIAVLRQYNIGYFIYIGGNDSMDTVHKLSKYCAEKDIQDIKVMGAPKTIDNDLSETDHCPGFGSAAKYIAATFSELVCDCNAYDIESVTIVEVMGRNAGWLTASSALSRLNGESGPQLIYVCERAFDENSFISDVKQKIKEFKNVVVAVSEGVKTSDGRYVGEGIQSGMTDVFGHKYLAGVGKYLEQCVREKIGCKVRSIELNLMQRCASHIASAVDIHESRMLGSVAADFALEGESGKMAVVRRISDKPYQVEFGAAEASKIANLEKKIPEDWINADGNDVTKKMMDYLYPLIQGEIFSEYENGIPKHLKLF